VVFEKIVGRSTRPALETMFMPPRLSKPTIKTLPAGQGGASDG
jgi:hypothetical protein